MNNLIYSVFFLATAHLASAQSIPDTMVEPNKSNSVYYYIDGIKIRGASNLPKSVLEEVTVVTGGLPGDYSQVNSGCFFRMEKKENECPQLDDEDRFPKVNYPETAAFNLVPNPASDVVEIAPINEDFVGGKVVFLSLSGNVLLVLEMKEITELVDVTTFSPGSYIVFMEKNGKTISETLIIK